MIGEPHVERAWPFENTPEPTRRPRGIKRPRDYVSVHGEGTEAVIVRIGLHDAQLVLVAPNGAWERWVHHSVEEAERAAESLGVPVHVGEYPEELRVRINSHRRSPEEYRDAAYPEQGKVGPVSGYPENRPRDPGAEAATPQTNP